MTSSWCTAVLCSLVAFGIVALSAPGEAIGQNRSAGVARDRTETVKPVAASDAPEKGKPEKGKPEKTAPSKSGGGDLKEILSEDDTNAPLYVKSDSLALNAKARVFTYSGNVEVQKGDLKITCDNMIGTYDETNQLENVLCKDNVVITRGVELKANANRANYAIKKALIELTEGPELARDGNVLSADKIMIFVDEDRSEAEGNVRVKVIKTEDASAAANRGQVNPATPVVQAPAVRTVLEPAAVDEDE